jgi:hypothetical protein
LIVPESLKYRSHSSPPAPRCGRLFSHYVPMSRDERATSERTYYSC